MPKVEIKLVNFQLNLGTIDNLDLESRSIGFS